MTQGVLKTHGICLMMYFKNNWNAGPFFLLHGYFRRKKTTHIYIYCCQIIILKYICTIYTRLYTCLTSIPRFSLRDKVTLRLLKLLFQGVDVVEWYRALDVRLSEWCCSVSMVWVQIPSREEQKFDSSKI